ncbi:MAG: hypothetical protein ABI823_01925 [Bryobacteraceae bacterium]
MDQTVLILMIVVSAISAVALCVQAGMLFGIYRTSKATHDKIVVVLPKLEKLLETSQDALEQSKKQILDITTKTNLILDSTREQLGKVDDLLTDASSRARVQMDRAELVLDDAMSRAQETVAVVHGGVMRPLREIQGVTAGLRTAFQVLLRGSRPTVAHVTQDEEMFI